MIAIYVKVKPGASKNEILIDEGGKLLIKIRERPVNGAANNYLIQFLSKEFHISKSAIIIDKGRTSRFKKIFIDTDPATLESILNRYKK